MPRRTKSLVSIDGAIFGSDGAWWLVSGGRERDGAAGVGVRVDLLDRDVGPSEALVLASVVLLALKDNALSVSHSGSVKTGPKGPHLLLEEDGAAGPSGENDDPGLVVV